MADHHLVFLEDHIVLAAGIDAALRAFDVAEVFEQYLHHTGEIGFLLEARPRILRMRHVEAHLISRGVDRCRPEMMRIEAALPRIDVEVGEDGVRSEERRVGKDCVGQCRSRWSRDYKKKKKNI